MKPHTLTPQQVNEVKKDVNAFPPKVKGFSSFLKEVRQRYRLTPKQLDSIIYN